MSPHRLLLSCCCALLLAFPLRGAAAEALHHVVVILDGSGSMSGDMPGAGTTKMKVAKGALQAVMAQVPADHRVGLLVFGGGAPPSHWAYPLDVYREADFAAALAPIGPEGKTPLGAFLKLGADALLEARQDQGQYGSYRLLVLTDGEASDGDLVERYLPDIIRRGILVDVIGVDMQDDLALARQVHRYRRANDAAALQQALQEAFAEVGDGSGDDDATQDFDLIAPLPADLAREALRALTEPGNGPIGALAPRPGAALAVAAGGGTATPSSVGISPLAVGIAVLIAFLVLVTIRRK